MIKSKFYVLFALVFFVSCKDSNLNIEEINESSIDSSAKFSSSIAVFSSSYVCSSSSMTANLLGPNGSIGVTSGLPGLEIEPIISHKSLSKAELIGYLNEAEISYEEGSRTLTYSDLIQSNLNAVRCEIKGDRFDVFEEKKIEYNNYKILSETTQCSVLESLDTLLFIEVKKTFNTDIGSAPLSVKKISKVLWCKD